MYRCEGRAAGSTGAGGAQQQWKHRDDASGDAEWTADVHDVLLSSRKMLKEHISNPVGCMWSGYIQFGRSGVARRVVAFTTEMDGTFR